MPLETLLWYERSHFSADVWALGVVGLQTLIKKQHIFGNKNFWHFDQNDKIKKLQDSTLVLY